ncbi:MAG: hypothetical protein ACLQDM_23035 [Bradyrhizobium sp.]
MAKDLEVIWASCEAEYFFGRGWTQNREGSLTGKSVECAALRKLRAVDYSTSGSSITPA